MIYCRCMRPVTGWQVKTLAVTETAINASLKTRCEMCGAKHSIDIDLDLNQVILEAVKGKELYLKGDYDNGPETK